MTAVLAAIDGSPVGTLVLAAAGEMARIFQADCEAVHVADPAVPVAVRAQAARAGVPLRILEGDPDRMLQGAFDSTGVVLGVLGVRDRNGEPRPPGHTTMSLLQTVHGPLLVVPPASGGLEAPMRRVLLPMDGTLTTARAVEDAVRLLGRSGTEFVVLHAFTTGTVPAFWNGGPQDQAAWEREFLARYCPTTNCRMVLRTGHPGRHVPELARSEHADLVALGWHHDLSAAHAAVVREALLRCPVPILLLHAEHQDPEARVTGSQDEGRNRVAPAPHAPYAHGDR